MGDVGVQFGVCLFNKASIRDWSSVGVSGVVVICCRRVVGGGEVVFCDGGVDFLGIFLGNFSNLSSTSSFG